MRIRRGIETMCSTGFVATIGIFCMILGPASVVAATCDPAFYPEVQPPGMNGAVRALTFFGGELYAGGSFTMAGDVPADHVAKWDGTSWVALGDGLNGDVYALAGFDNKLYAGGFFTTASGAVSDYIAQWDGTSWS